MKTRMRLCLSMARYHLTTASLVSGDERTVAIEPARKQWAMYWAIKYGVKV